MYKLVEVEDVGSVLFKKNKKYKRLSMKVDREGGVVVNIPYLVSLSFAKSWVEEKKDWIINSIKKIEKRNSMATVFIPGLVYKTFMHTILFVWSNRKGINVEINLDKVQISFSNDITQEEIISDISQKRIRKLVEDILKYEAKKYLIPRTKDIAQKLGFKHGVISVRNNKSRWGSCSQDDNISLNIHLMRLPKHLIDYVILHELCHTKEKNHSESFWNVMEKVCPNSKSKRKELGRYSTIIY